MTIEKKNFGKLLLLNCVTLGIYGAVMHQRLGNEINALCGGDEEKPRMSYILSVLISLIGPALAALIIVLFALITGVSILAQIRNDLYDISRLAMLMGLSILPLLLLLSLAGIIGILCSVYREYWWYKQTGRIKLNAWRYGLMVRESGVDTILFRTLAQIPLAAVNVVCIVLHLVVPALFCGLISLISLTASEVLVVICVVVFSIFLPDCTAGAYLAIWFTYKNMNRIVNTGASGKEFDPMGYEYYPSISNHYASAASHLVYDEYTVKTEPVSVRQPVLAEIKEKPVPPAEPAYLEMIKGRSKGYSIELPDGEEVVVGRNPAQANIVIDNVYEKVSGKHVGVMFDKNNDNFRVIDYSLNGTYVDGKKLEGGKEYTFRRGVTVELEDGSNTFVLK